jgi:thioredoxin 1
MAHTFTDDNFETEVLDYKDGPVLVDFYAVWCGPCQIEGPIVEALAEELKDSKIKIGKLDVDAANATAGKYEVMSIPTIIIFKNGEIVETLVGLQSKETLKDKVEKLSN